MPTNYTHRIMPDYITNLEENEMFIFGSNLKVCMVEVLLA